MKRAEKGWVTDANLYQVSHFLNIHERIAFAVSTLANLADEVQFEYHLARPSSLDLVAVPSVISAHAAVRRRARIADGR